MSLPILTTLILLPLLGGIAVLFTSKQNPTQARQLALLVSLTTFAVSILMWVNFDATSADYQMVERYSWMPDFGISYHVGVDGISLLLVVLTTFLTPIALLCSWESIESRVREFSFFMLALEAAMIGVFISRDLFLFYVFWDAMLIPMYFLIGVWGYDRRIYASIKFILYTMAGSVLMLIAIIWLAYHHQTATGVMSFDLADLMALKDIPASLQTYLFLAFAVAFAIKVPLFPFHTWLPDAHVEAPTAGSVILAGVLLKMGTYGLLRNVELIQPNDVEAVVAGGSVMQPRKPNDGDQHQHAAGHRVEDELDHGVDASFVAPHADEEVHRDQDEVPEHVEEEEIQSGEDAQHRRLEQQHEDRELLDLLVDTLPRRQQRDRRQEAGQDDQHQADPVDSQVVVDAKRRNPGHPLDELELLTRCGGIESRPQRQRCPKGEDGDGKRNLANQAVALPVAIRNQQQQQGAHHREPDDDGQ